MKKDKQLFEEIFSLFDYAIVHLNHPSYRGENLVKVKQMIRIQQRIKDDFLSI